MKQFVTMSLLMNRFTQFPKNKASSSPPTASQEQRLDPAVDSVIGVTQALVSPSTDAEYDKLTVRDCVRGDVCLQTIVANAWVCNSSERPDKSSVKEKQSIN